MKIRDATVEDLKFISEIESACWGGNGASLDEFQEFISGKSKSEFLQVLESNGNVQGFIGYSYDIHENSIYIWNLAVSSQFQRSGYGTQLIKQVLSVGKLLKAKSLTLEVSESNLGAIELYQKLGFENNSKIKNYYPDGSAGFKFSLSI